jgi:HEAT repeat protein/beta-lactamase regulating signal transducer with metallopeptidase domain
MSSAITAISQLIDTLGRVPFIVAALTKGSLLVLVAVGLTRLLARAPAAARHLVWSLAVAGLLLLPATSLIPWHLELPALAAARDAFTVTPAGAPTSGTTRTAVDRRVDRSNSPAPTSANATVDAAKPQVSGPQAPLTSATMSRLRDPAAVLILAWLAGTLWMLGRLAVGVINVRRMVGHSSPADGSEWQSLVDRARNSLGARPNARIVISDRAAMPFTYGLLRPTIVLPASAEEWTAERRRSVLLHELAHVRRRDLLTNAVVQLACAVYWFHPLVRLASRRVRIEAERACDALVVAAGTRPSDYAGDLLEIARTMRSSATAAVALAMARRSDFEGRLLAILAPDSGRNVLTAARAVLVALSFAAPAVAIAAATPATRVVPNAVVAAPPTTTPDSEATVVAEAPHAALVGHAPLAAQTEQDAQAPGRTQGRDTAVPALLSVLKDESAVVRLAAIESLGHLNDPRAIDALVQALKTDTDARVREAAAQALGEIDNQRAVPGLIAALGTEKVGAVRAKIAWALGEIDDARAVDALGVAVKDSEVEVRRQAVWALGELEAPAAAPMLIPVLRDADVETRKQAAWALGQVKGADAVSALSGAAKDSDKEVRKQVIESLGEIQDKRALPALSAAISDAEAEIREAAVQSISQLEDLKTAPPALLTALRDDERSVRKAAAEALGQIEDESAVPALIPLTRDSSTDVKHAAVEALANIGGARAIEVMAALLKDDDPEIRKLAAQALGKNR